MMELCLAYRAIVKTLAKYPILTDPEQFLFLKALKDELCEEVTKSEEEEEGEG